MICHTCGRCVRCNRFVGYGCCGTQPWHYCPHQHTVHWWWNGYQYVQSTGTFGSNHTHSHTHTHHHHHAHNPVRHDAGSAIQALAGRK